MNDRIKNAFDQVQAGEELKDRTRAYLFRKTAGYTRRRNRYQPVVSAAACFLFLVLGGYWFYFTPTAKISIDVNPSIELGINRVDRVIRVDAYNDDGQELAASLNIRFKRYGEAVCQIMESERVAALLSQDEIMTITVMESGGAQSVRILSDMESCAAGHQNTYCYLADSREVAAAHEHGMSCGKYRAFLELKNQRPDIPVTPEEIQGMTMREIQDLMEETPGCEEEKAHGDEEEASSGSHRRTRNHGGGAGVQGSGSRKHGDGAEGQESGSWEHESGAGVQESGSREHGDGAGGQESGNREQGSGSQGHRDGAGESGERTRDHGGSDREPGERHRSHGHRKS